MVCNGTKVVDGDKNGPRLGESGVVVEAVVYRLDGRGHARVGDGVPVVCTDLKGGETWRERWFEWWAGWARNIAQK